MNKLTQEIKLKGYTLSEFLRKINHSLRWYRTHEKVGSPSYNFLVEQINKLDDK